MHVDVALHTETWMTAAVSNSGNSQSGIAALARSSSFDSHLHQWRTWSSHLIQVKFSRSTKLQITDTKLYSTVVAPSGLQSHHPSSFMRSYIYKAPLTVTLRYNNGLGWHCLRLYTTHISVSATAFYCVKLLYGMVLWYRGSAPSASRSAFSFFTCNAIQMHQTAAI
jgi:hypothetical protein